MERIVTAQEMRAIEQDAMGRHRIPQAVLMERAALGVAHTVRAILRKSNCAAHEPDGAVNASDGAVCKPDISMCKPGGAARKPQILVVAGKGNNGADGIAAGRILLLQGYEVRFIVQDLNPAEGSMLRLQMDIAESLGAKMIPFSAEDCEDPDVLIDALFGTGYHKKNKVQAGTAEDKDTKHTRPAEEIVQTGIADQMLQFMHRTGAGRIVSVDMPSGVSGDDGSCCESAVNADVTVTFGLKKLGQVMYPGARYCGRVIVWDIGLPVRPDLPEQADPAQVLTIRARTDIRSVHRKDADKPDNTQQSVICTDDGSLVRAHFMEHHEDGNKGTFGKVLLIEGSQGIAGCAVLSAKAALRAGAGLVTVYSDPGNRIIIQTAVPEAVFSADDKNLIARMQWADAIAIGPGIGKDDAAAEMLETVLRTIAGGKSKTGMSGHAWKGLVIDADAVRLIAERNLYDVLDKAAEAVPIVLTPHMAECAALLQTSVPELQKNRFSAVKAFADRHHCALICKDARTVAAAWDCGLLFLNTLGNDGMATGGSGDVLTGITAAVLAQPTELSFGSRLFDRAVTAVEMHAMAGDAAAAKREKRSITAMDIAECIGR